MMFTEEGCVESDKGVPLFIVKLGLSTVSLCQGCLLIVDFYTLCFYHDEAGVDAFYFRDKLFLRDWSCLWLHNNIVGFLGQWLRGFGR